MRVQAGAGVILIGLGHERGRKPMAAGQSLDQHFEQPCIIRRPQGIVAMHQVDLKLAQTCLADRGVGGNVHFLAGVIKIGKEGIELIQCADRQGFSRLAPLARAGRDRDLQVAARIVDQEKLKLHRADRRQAAHLEPVQHRAQGMAWITAIGAAILMEHPDRQQGGGRIEPRHRHKATLGRFQNAVAVAGFKHQRAVVDVFAPDIKAEHRERKAGAVGCDLIGKAGGNAFAARLAIEISGGHTDCADLRMFAEPIVHNTPEKAVGIRRSVRA